MFTKYLQNVSFFRSIFFLKTYAYIRKTNTWQDHDKTALLNMPALIHYGEISKS